MKVCDGCFFESNDSEDICENCGKAFISQQERYKQRYVRCQECYNETLLSSGEEESFFCQNCNKQIKIDGFIHRIIERNISNEISKDLEQTLATLIFEETNTGQKFSFNSEQAEKEPVSFGRYGDVGASFFQSQQLLTVSGEHVLISSKGKDWYITPNSNTNDTVIGGMRFTPDDTKRPVLIKNGQIMRIGGVSFRIVIGD